MADPQDQAIEEMVEGYMAGFEDHRSELGEGVNRSDAWCFGWRNGRDDRIGSPRADAQTLRDMGAAIVEAAQ